jgi:hypothetical protein
LDHAVCLDIKKRSLGRHKRWSSQKRRGVASPMPVHTAELVWESRHGQNDAMFSEVWERKQQEKIERKYLHAQGQCLTSVLPVLIWYQALQDTSMC